MGMSASQARFLSLTARKTNVEYEGQQINQQRTTLSNESANYYSRLTSMEVPIPPSTEDYTKITYTFENGSEKNTVTSLVATKDTSKSGIYMLNYVQQTPSYNMVVNGTSLISKTGTNGNEEYYIGKVKLQDAATDETINGDKDTLSARFISAGIPAEIVSQYSLAEMQNKMKVENQYRLLANEKYGEQGWSIRYVQNTSTGNFEPVFYSKSEIEGADYNDKTGLSLIAIKALMYDQTTESREIKNVKAKVTQDASGRYQTITIYNEEDITSEIVSIDTRTSAEQKRAEEWKKSEPDINDYIDETSSTELYEIYNVASESCHINAVGGSAGCYKHVLAHMLDLSLDDSGNVNTSVYPKTYKSSASDGSNDVNVPANAVSGSAIKSAGQTAAMQAVSDAVKYGFKPSGKTRRYTVTTKPHPNTDTQADKYLSSYYISQDNATDSQKLLSNYYKDANGVIINKTLEQKCVDLFKAIDMYAAGTLVDANGALVDYNDVLVPVLYSLDDDMKNFTINDKEAYDEDYRKWQEEKPAKLEPEYQDVEVYSTKGGVTYILIATTETDDAAYNDAMNQYLYNKAVYDKRVEEVNSQIKIIQVQDKNLELKLKQLDTEQNAIQTEMDAVKKVISKNVESSFKTFNA